jgi:serine/threonine protein kinase
MGCNSSTLAADNNGVFQSQNDVRFTEISNSDPHGNFHKNYVLHRKVSQGGYAQVHLACKVDEARRVNSQEMRKTNSKDSRGSQLSLANFSPNRSVKIVDTRMKPKNIAKLAQNEADIWKNLQKHNHIVRLMNTKQEFGMCFFIMEMCSMSVLQYLSSMPIVDERTLGESFTQMLLGIEFLHKSNVVHRDIKPDHFVVGGDTEKTIKLCDFALATVHDHQMTGECGTALFMAPEMVLHREYDAKVDVWSFGVIVYALLFGRFPYDVDGKDSSDVKQTIASSTEAPSFKTVYPVSPSALAFSSSLLCRDPLQRPSASTALKKKFVIDVITQNHEVDSDLPNLRDQLHHMKQLRAFQNRDLEHKSEIDDMLNRQQLFVHGLPIPGVKHHSIAVQKLGSTKSLDSHHSHQKRNSFSSFEEAEKLSFTLGEKVKLAELANGISKGTVGKVIGFTDSHVNVDFPGCTRKKFKQSQLLKVDGRGSIRNSNNSSPLSSLPREDSSLFSQTQSESTQTGSQHSSDDSSTSIETCDVESEFSEI